MKKYLIFNNIEEYNKTLAYLNIKAGYPSKAANQVMSPLLLLNGKITHLGSAEIRWGQWLKNWQNPLGNELIINSIDNINDLLND